MLYSLFGALTVFGTGNATQVNTIVTAIDTALTQLQCDRRGPHFHGEPCHRHLCAMLVAMVLLGGIKRIGSVSEKARAVYGAFVCAFGAWRGCP